MTTTADSYIFRPSFYLYSLQGVLIAKHTGSFWTAWEWAQERIADRRDVEAEQVRLREANEGEPADLITIDGADAAYLVDAPTHDLFLAHFAALDLAAAA